MTNKYLNALDEDILQFDYEWREGSRDKAREIAKAYVNKHREFLEPVLMQYTREMLVYEVEALRRFKRLSDRIVVDMWLLSEYEPVEIVGKINVTLPQPASLLEALNKHGNL